MSFPVEGEYHHADGRAPRRKLWASFSAVKRYCYMIDARGGGVRVDYLGFEKL